MDVAVEASAISAGPWPPTLRDWMGVLEDIPEAAFVLTGSARCRVILGVNGRGARLFGYERGEVVNRPAALLMPSPGIDAHPPSPAVPVGGGVLASRGRRRDGSEFPIEIRCTDPAPGREAVGIAIVRDISHGFDARRLLMAERDAAVTASRWKSQFLAAASHDLRQPLQAICTLQAMLAHALAHSAYSAPLAAIGEAARTMGQMLGTLLDINRLEAGAIEPVIADFPLREILPALRAEFAAAAANRAVTLEVEDSAEFARSDRALLPVILRNLLGNAIKYTRRGVVRLQVRAADDQLYIDVRDTGIGIAPENVRRLFDAFYQVEDESLEAREGVGLGLSIVQQFSHFLDHRVTIESRLGEGSTFTLRLPRGMAEQTRPLPGAAGTDTPSGGPSPG